MKTEAALLYQYKSDLVIKEIFLEKPHDTEVLVEFRAAGLCHSDLNLIKGDLPLPLPCIPGHEGAGVVLEVGEKVKQIQVGDHVVPLWVPSCGNCFYCLRGQHFLCQLKQASDQGKMNDGTSRLNDGKNEIRKMCGVGSFSKHQVLDEQNLVVIDKEISFEAAAVAGCAVITGVGAVFNTAKVRPGDTVAVYGVGGVGLNIVRAAELSNAKTIIAIDINKEKLKTAIENGATHTINPFEEKPNKKIKEFTKGLGVDFAFEVLGKPETAITAFQCTRFGGTLVLVGLPKPTEKIELPYYLIPITGRKIIGCLYGSANQKNDLITILQLYKSGKIKIDDMISQKYKFEDINIGLRDLENGKNIRGVVMY